MNDGLYDVRWRSRRPWRAAVELGRAPAPVGRDVAGRGVVPGAPELGVEPPAAGLPAPFADSPGAPAALDGVDGPPDGEPLGLFVVD